MAPKKKPAAKGDGKEDEVSIDDFRTNYVKASKTLGIPPSTDVTAQLQPQEDEGTMTQFCTDADLGPAGVRALCAAILGAGTGMKGGPYTPLKSIRLWRNNARDAGAAAVAEVLALGKDKVQLTHLQLMDNKIGPPGCLALGEALMLGANTSLMTLRLDHNTTIGSEGLLQLVKGLRTNPYLSSLYLPFCGIDAAGGAHLAQLLEFPASKLGLLDLEGNHIGSAGLAAMCGALSTNTALKKLLLPNNGVGGDEEDSANMEAFAALAAALTSPTGGLASLDLSMNPVTAAQAEVLVPALESNSRVTEFLIHDGLPPEIFDKISKVDSGGKKGGKKGKKGKK